MAEETENPEGEGEIDQDALMAEWETMADDGEQGEEGKEGEQGEEDGAPGSTRVLDQSEIDSLLGVDSDGLDDGDKSGIQAILNSALVSYERLPMLEVVFDRLVRMMSTSLRNFTSDNVDIMRTQDDVDHLKKVLPRIIDNFQVYLRELRVEDLRGSAGLQRLREELLMRVSNAARPAQIRDILFREMLVQ